MTYLTEFRVYVDFDNDGSFTTSGDDISAYVKSVDGTRGMQDDLQRVAHVGTCSIRLNNKDRLFSPLYTGGTYYGKLLPNLPVKVEVVTDGTTHAAFRGLTKAWRVASNKYSSVEATLECEDLLGVMQDYDLALPLQEDQTADYLLKLIGSAAFGTARATGYVDFAGNVSNNDTVTVGDVTYTFKTALTTPAVAGEVLIGADATESAENLIAAINGEEGAGTTYSTGTERADVATASLDGETLYIPTAGVAQGFAIGRFDNGKMYHEGQRIKVNTGGLLSQFELWFGNRSGTPVGDVKWAWYDAREGIPGPYSTLYESGTFTPAGAEPVWNTITPAGTTYLEPGHYFLYLLPNSPQSTGDYWVVLASDGNAGDVYADGAFDQLQADPPESWGEWANQDMTLKVTLAPRPRVTLTANARGAWGNAIALAESGANLSVSDANLTGGVDGPVGLMSYETGKQTITVAGDNWAPDNKTSALDAATDAVHSEWGLFWAATDGTLTFKNRDWLFLQQATASVLTLDDEPDATDGAVSIDEVYNQAVLSYQPRDELTPGIVARMTEPYRLPGKQERKRRNPSDPTPYAGEVVSLSFVDPSTGQNIGAKDIIHPVPGTDYTVTWGIVGTGVDRSGQGFVTCTMAINASGVEVVFQNTHRRSVFVHGFQVRGTGLVRYDPEQIVVEDATSLATYGRRGLPGLSIPFPSTRAFAESVAAYLLSRHKDPTFRIPTIGFTGQTVIGSTALYSVDVGDIVTVTEYQTALDAARFMVMGVRFRLEMGGRSELQWYVRRMDDVTYGIYDDATYGLYNSARYTI